MTGPTGLPAPLRRGAGSRGVQPSGFICGTGVLSRRQMSARVDRTCHIDSQRRPGRVFRLSVPAIRGGRLHLSRYRGRVILLAFWATWCRPCHLELPHLIRLYRHYRKHGLALVLVATDDDRQLVRDIAHRLGLTGDIAFRGGRALRAAGSRAIPFSMVLDRRGRIAGTERGYRPDCLPALEEVIREQLLRRPTY